MSRPSITAMRERGIILGPGLPGGTAAWVAMLSDEELVDLLDLPEEGDGFDNVAAGLTDDDLWDVALTLHQMRHRVHARHHVMRLTTEGFTEQYGDLELRPPPRSRS